MAIDSLNFWVLLFVLKNFQASNAPGVRRAPQVQAKALLCHSRAPLRRLLKALSPPSPPEARLSEPL